MLLVYLNDLMIEKKLIQKKKELVEEDFDSDEMEIEEEIRYDQNIKLKKP